MTSQTKNDNSEWSIGRTSDGKLVYLDPYLPLFTDVDGKRIMVLYVKLGDNILVHPDRLNRFKELVSDVRDE